MYSFAGVPPAYRHVVSPAWRDTSSNTTGPSETNPPAGACAGSVCAHASPAAPRQASAAGQRASRLVRGALERNRFIGLLRYGFACRPLQFSINVQLLFGLCGPALRLVDRSEKEVNRGLVGTVLLC